MIRNLAMKGAGLDGVPRARKLPFLSDDVIREYVGKYVLREKDATATEKRAASANRILYFPEDCLGAAAPVYRPISSNKNFLFDTDMLRQTLDAILRSYSNDPLRPACLTVTSHGFDVTLNISFSFK